MRRAWAGAIALTWVVACGGRTAIERPKPYDAGPSRVVAETCNGLDDDADGQIDEDFRDRLGNYLNDAHCGRCGHACDQPIANATQLGCELVGDAPACVAHACMRGFERSRGGGCAALDDHLCMACREAADCGALATARCIEIGGEPHCTRACSEGCPSGYVCVAADHCEPASSSCSCQGGAQDFALACELHGRATGCTGSAQCRGGVLSACSAPEEHCDGLDNDCDGTIDEDFVDELGAYSKNLENCGACGVSCRSDQNAGVPLACGGDPFAPSCVTSCPDLLDGIQIGDHLDADRRIDNGCECRVSALSDSGGAPANEGQLDANCDGADGNVRASFYVTLEGDDTGPGSPTRPLRSISVAIERAYASISSALPRPHVYVASGVYTESLRMRDGVSLHGGYRSDFLAENPSGFPVVVVAPADTSALGGAALVVDRGGQSPTLVEGFSFRGRDATANGEPAIGIELVDPGTLLTLRNLTVLTGKPGAGLAGARGEAGVALSASAGDGDAPRAAFEDASHNCTSGDGNRGHGGGGAQNRCGGVDVSGGNGGSSVCPVFGVQEASGQTGHARLVATGGTPGHGGDDLSAPIMNDPACAGVCCGLADFTVPGDFTQATAGSPGQNGALGVAGTACSDALGGFAVGADAWSPGRAFDGRDGDAGGGGGGGGSGSGAQIMWVAGACEFADGLGGGGGGGGAGGCGGKAGHAGEAGGPAIGVLIRTTNASALPTLEALQVTVQDGAAGGDGGAGGDGALGGNGGFGGRVPDALRSTPTLAGPMPGERGGKGGDGGAAGAGGGGCGGSAVGLWLTGIGVRPELVTRFRSGNQFSLGAGGQPGRGGGGAVPAIGGAAGQRMDVLVQ